MTGTASGAPPALFGSGDRREALRVQVEGYVGRANQMMRRARMLVSADRVDAIPLLIRRRTELGNHFQRYQQLKHGSIFDPIVAFAPTSSKIIARTMKVDCMELGEEFARYNMRWSRVPTSDWHLYKSDMLATVNKLTVNLEAELRAIRQLLMVAEFYGPREPSREAIRPWDERGERPPTTRSGSSPPLAI